jgi:hypothetical protein
VGGFCTLVDEATLALAAMTVAAELTGWLFARRFIETLWSLGVRGDEVHQNQFQLLDVGLVPFGSGFLYVVDDDLAYMRHSILGMNEVFPEFGGDYFRHVLVLGYCLYFIFGQFAQTDTVL